PVGRRASAGAARSGGPVLVPAPWALAAAAFLGLAAVIQLPELASLLPYGDRPEPNEAQLAITALGLIALTGAYLYVAWNVVRLSPAWAGLTFGYLAAIVVAKFILSPAALHNAPGTTLAQHVWVGMAVLVLYVAGLGTVYAVASRNRSPRTWSWSSKAVVVVGLLAFALVSRYVVALALGRAAADYLRDVFLGAGLWLPAMIGAAALAAVAAFDKAAHPPAGVDPAAALRTTLVVGLALLAVYQGLWVVYMLQLF
ncbi:MAG: hypothetical protein QOJ69_1036, partial [Actinomycetota bacterium]|nr:hypothetical protein [Actinomycetota bacterium]